MLINRRSFHHLYFKLMLCGLLVSLPGYHLKAQRVETTSNTNMKSSVKDQAEYVLKLRSEQKPAKDSKAYRRVWVQDSQSVPFRDIPQKHKKLRQKLKAAVKEEKGLDLVSEQERIRWVRTLASSYYGSRQLQIAWKLEARWILLSELVPQSEGFLAIIALQDALTGESVWRNEYHFFSEKEMYREIPNWIQRIQKVSHTAPRKHYVAIENRIKSYYPQRETDLYKKIREAVKAKGVVVLDPDLSEMVIREKHLFRNKKPLSDPYWTRPQRDVQVVRYALNLFTYKKGVETRDQVKLRLDIGMGEQGKRHFYHGSWDQLAMQLNEGLNMLRAESRERFGMESGDRLELTEGERLVWQAWREYYDLGSGPEIPFAQDIDADLQKEIDAHAVKIKKLAEKYPWFTALYRRAGITEDASPARNHMSRGAAATLLPFFRELQKRHGILSDDYSLKVSEIIGNEYLRIENFHLMSYDSQAPEILKIYEADPELSLVYFPFQTVGQLWKKGQKQDAFDLAMRAWSMRIYRIYPYPVEFLEVLLKLEEYALAQEVVDGAFAWEQRYTASRLQHYQVVKKLEKAGQEDFAAKVRLIVQTEESDGIAFKDIFKTYFKTPQHYELLLKRHPVMLTRVLNQQRELPKVIEQNKGDLALYRDEGQWELMRWSSDEAISFTVNDIEHRQLKLEYQVQEARITEDDQQVWMLLDRFGLVRLEQMKPVKLVQVNADWMKGLELNEIRLVNGMLHVVAWDKRAEQAVMGVLLKNEEWLTQRLAPELGMAHDIIYTQDHQVYLKHPYKYLITCFNHKKGTWKLHARMNEYGMSPRYIVMNQQLVLASEHGLGQDPIRSFDPQKQDYDWLYFSPRYWGRLSVTHDPFEWLILGDEDKTDLNAVPMNGAPRDMMRVGEILIMQDGEGDLTLTKDGKQFYGPFHLGEPYRIASAGDRLLVKNDQGLFVIHEKEIEKQWMQAVYRSEPAALYQQLKKDMKTWMDGRPAEERLRIYTTLQMHSEEADLLMKIQPKPSLDLAMHIYQELRYADREKEANDWLKSLGYVPKHHPDMEQAELESLRDADQWQKLIDLTDWQWKNSLVRIKDIPSFYRGVLPLWAVHELKGEEAYIDLMWRRLHGEMPDSNFDWDESNEAYGLMSKIQDDIQERFVRLMREKGQFDQILDHPLLGTSTHLYDYSNGNMDLLIQAGRTEEARDLTKESSHTISVLFKTGAYEELLSHAFPTDAHSQNWIIDEYTDAAFYTGNWKAYDQYWQHYHGKQTEAAQMRRLRHDLIMCLRNEHEQAARLYAQAWGKNNYGAWDQADQLYAKIIELAPGTLNSALAQVKLAERLWLEKGESVKAEALFDAALKQLEQLRSQGKADQRFWASYSAIPLLYAVKGESRKARELMKQIATSSYDASRFVTMMQSGTQSTEMKLSVSVKEEVKPLRIQGVNLKSAYMICTPPAPVGPENVSYYKNPLGNVWLLFEPEKGETWNSCWVYLYKNRHRWRPSLGWVYLKHEGLEDWVWVIYHHLEGKAAKELELKIDALNTKVKNDEEESSP